MELSVPTAETGNTNGWYRQFQALVLKIPTVGIRRTNRWYFRYHGLGTYLSHVPNFYMEQRYGREVAWEL